MEKYICKHCGRTLSSPSPHKCNCGFRKRHLKFDAITDNGDEINEFVQNIFGKDFSNLSAATDKTDMVNHPPHYTWLRDLAGIEVIDITRHMNFNLGNAVKYILRAGRKDPTKQIEDLRKAEFYIKDEINRLTNESK